MIRAIVFDFDGTLTDGQKCHNCWETIWREINDTATDQAYCQRYLAHEFDYRGWLDLITTRFQARGVNRALLLRAAQKLVLLPGVAATLRALAEQDIKLFVLSGGIQPMIQAVLPRACQKYLVSIEAHGFAFGPAGQLETITLPKHDLEHKEQFVRSIMDKYALQPAEVLFVGNDYNDETVYHSGALTLCINPQKTDINNRKIWTYGMAKCQNLAEILPYVSRA